MIRIRSLFFAAAALGAVACFQGEAPAPPRPRRAALEQAVRLRRTNPSGAAAWARRAGAGPALEAYRLRLWADTLERSHAVPKAWRELLAQELPPAMEVRALLGLGGSLLRAGREDEAVAVLQKASGAGSEGADELLLGVSRLQVRRGAARRLAVRSPDRLHRSDPILEREIVGGLTPAERLLRGRAWRESGSPRRTVRELGGLRWRGDLETRRRLAVARAWIAAGEPARALRILPPPSRAVPEVLLVRAQAERREAWDRFPRDGSAGAFRRALGLARGAARSGNGKLRREALTIVLETATETGRLEEAWNAWRSLAAMGWRGGRRGWLGRRLGIAMARRSRRLDRVAELEAELPAHRSCLLYWRAQVSSGRRRVLRKLAGVNPGGLYATWAREELGIPAPSSLPLAAPVGVGQVPRPVQLLLRWGDPGGARRQWRAYRDLRGTTPGEALAAAAFEVSGPRPGEAIRWLRRAFPRLGDPDLEGCPVDAVQLYLPLRWTGALRRAAAEAGVDPWLLAALVRQESGFVPHARSARGAVGLSQMIPATARRHARALGMGPQPDLEDPAVNLRLAARELAHLLDRFGAIEPALAAYNAGEARVARWWRRWPESRRFTEEIPVPETYGYVRRVVYLDQAYRAVWGATLKDSTQRR